MQVKKWEVTYTETLSSSLISSEREQVREKTKPLLPAPLEKPKGRT